MYNKDDIHVIDYETMKIKSFNSWDLCMFVNDMMGDKSFKSKRYLFLPNADVALKVLDDKKENE
jgi:hypothetical protein